ncbi:sugar-binding transcriptional regulator, partial [Shewanella sp. SR43-4]|jgi:DNA-binding transcriptional regulator LsrR (DeoR family)|uniref:Sugar-binding transcriptional regulator n=2 Tax=Shewanella TaxID=22 RepID=A0ABV0FMK6_9GAMM|nr:MULTISPECIES: sugar-binding transcriptional regulator [Shewanella]NCQ43847.1 sugar-binding transcriptional regulator [Shewanella frigidimarina]MBB1317057.1 sugar-binding transcriptional regulator [Shewanella sp. SR43-4]NCO70221.1 sugar-binding transcriptional regulator [Shewanella vesiculosa]NCP35761.1 sugar-binding transcriptional regulator [Shewanella vesiculosa]NCP68342.1 sugar-binding transcriptional regulator [Shewanella vesiculosa]|tara:strand:- start:7007 stop:7969 length:963 start_codon:yes stop_codon:yes gene_type:complete
MDTKSNSELARLEQAARAAWLYYVAKNTQDEIAQKLEVSRQSAQRLVALAVSEGLIQVRLDHPIAKCMELGHQLTQAFNLLECEIVPSDPADSSSVHGLAQGGASVLERYLKSEQPKTLAFGTGRALKACIDELPSMQCPQHKIVSLLGNMMLDGSASAFDIVVSMANRVQAKHYPMPLPVIASSVAEKQLLHDLAPVKSIFELVKQADATFVGIGHMGIEPPLLLDGFINQSQLDALVNNDAIGEIISWVYNQQGQLLDNSINQLVMSSPLNIDLTNPVYGIAAGQQKVDAIFAALQGRLINSLITNEYTAERLLAKLK